MWVRTRCTCGRDSRVLFRTDPVTGSDVAGCVGDRGTLRGTRAVRGEAGGSRASTGSPRSGCRNAVNRRARLAGGTDPEPVEDTHAPVCRSTAIAILTKTIIEIDVRVLRPSDVIDPKLI